MNKSIKIDGMTYFKNSNKLRLGDCVCVIKNRNDGTHRLAEGSVVRFPYSKDATLETRKKYGKNMIYVCYRDYEDVVGMYQKPIKIKNSLSKNYSFKRTGK